MAVKIRERNRKPRRRGTLLICSGRSALAIVVLRGRPVPYPEVRFHCCLRSKQRWQL